MKNYIITFGITLAVCVIVIIVTLMINVPQVDIDDLSSIEKYEKVVPEEFGFDNNKNITQKPPERDYVVTGEQINKYINNNLYNPGNSNPFTPNGDLNNSTNNNTDDETNDKTDSSNNGQTNDSNTGK